MCNAPSTLTGLGSRPSCKVLNFPSNITDIVQSMYLLYLQTSHDLNWSTGISVEMAFSLAIQFTGRSTTHSFDISRTELPFLCISPSSFRFLARPPHLSPHIWGLAPSQAALDDCDLNRFLGLSPLLLPSALVHRPLDKYQKLQEKESQRGNSAGRTLKRPPVVHCGAPSLLSRQLT